MLALQFRRLKNNTLFVIGDFNFVDQWISRPKTVAFDMGAQGLAKTLV